jgi:hypothetical protein
MSSKRARGETLPNGRAWGLKFSQSKLPEYADSAAGMIRGGISHLDGQQSGDPRRAAEALILLSEAAEQPLRLPLGSDAVSTMRKHLTRTTRELDAWAGVREHQLHGVVRALPIRRGLRQAVLRARAAPTQSPAPYARSSRRRPSQPMAMPSDSCPHSEVVCTARSTMRALLIIRRACGLTSAAVANTAFRCQGRHLSTPPNCLWHRQVPSRMSGSAARPTSVVRK